MDINSQEHIKTIAPVVAKAYQLGKEQKYDEAYQTLLPLFEAKEIPSYFEEPCGWTIYRYLKNKESKLSSLEIRKALSYYLDFATCKSGTLHSCMMMQAANLEKKHENDFRFIDFCLMWDLNSFRDEDYQSSMIQTEDGKNIEYQSLAEDVATRLYREMKSRHTEEFSTKLLPYFKKVKERCPDNRFIHMYIAQLLYWQGNLEESISAYKIILRNSPEWYIWKNLGDIVDTNELRISFYCKALTMIGKDDYIGDLRQKLASLLIDSNKEQAAYEIEQYIKTYKANNWNIVGDVYIMQGKLQGVIPSNQAKVFYRNNIEAAENYVYSDIPTEELILAEIFKNHAGKERAKLTNKGKHIEVRTSLTPLLRSASIGEVLLVRLTKINDRLVPLTIHKTGKIVESLAKKQNGQNKVMTGNKVITGIISLPPKGDYCFIDHIYYVSEQLRKTYNLQDGQKVEAEVKQLPDGRWRVVKIKKSKV